MVKMEDITNYYLKSTGLFILICAILYILAWLLSRRNTTNITTYLIISSYSALVLYSIINYIIFSSPSVKSAQSKYIRKKPEGYLDDDLWDLACPWGIIGHNNPNNEGCKYSIDDPLPDEYKTTTMIM